MVQVQRLTVNIQEIQLLTGMGREHVLSLVRKGVLPNVGNSKRFLVPRTALERYLENAGQGQK